MGRGQPPGKLRNTQNKDTGQQPVRTPLVDRCGRTENSTENSRLDRLGNLDYALAPQDHPSRSTTSPGTTLPARCHGDPLSQLPSRYFHRPTEMDAKLRASRERPHDSAGGEDIRRHRMRFSVTSRRPGSVEQPPARLRGTMGNGSTGQMRSSNPPPGSGAACARVRISRFGVWPHGKAHFATPPSRCDHIGCAFP